MGDQPGSPTSDSYTILGLSKGATPKEIYKAYKSLVKKWHPDKHKSNKSEAHAKFDAINQAYKVLNQTKMEEKNGRHNDDFEEGSRSMDDICFLKKPSFLSRSISRRSKTPNPVRERYGSSRTKNNTGFEEITCWNISSPITVSHNTVAGVSNDQTSVSPVPSMLPKSLSRTGSNPIIYSQSIARRKPPPIERKLECTLEELCHGSVKNIRITRDVINDIGMITKEEEILKVKIKPGWRKGTKVTFESKGDEKLGSLPADIVFLIHEKKHPLFVRDGDDLEIAVEVPLIQALTGCQLQVPLLGETKEMTVHIDDVIYPGYEKVIRGQGMPKSKREGVRGDLRIKFLVEFPLELADEQRADAAEILQDCTWDE